MSDERFGQNLSTWLDEDAAHRVPSHVNELLVLSAASRQRPWWSSLERWLPMSTTTMGGRLAAPRPMLLFALLAALLAAIVGATLLAAAVLTTAELRHAHCPTSIVRRCPRTTDDRGSNT